MIYETIFESEKYQKNFKTIVFVDYDSLFWGLYNTMGELPDMRSLLQNIRQRNLASLRVRIFGDFSKPELKREISHLRSVTTDIISCELEHRDVKKDITDFVMLDHIYQSILLSGDFEQYILVTGDGHFQSVATFLRVYQNKIVGLYGVKGTISPRLKGSVSWAVEIRPQEEITLKSKYVQDILYVLKQAAINDKKAFFKKTVQIAAESFKNGNKRDYARYNRALGLLMERGYVKQEQELSLNGNGITVISVLWDKVERDKLF